MEDARQVWSWWQSLLAVFGSGFTRPGWVRFVQWVTGMVMCWEEHTITQILISLGLESRWRVMEHFAEYGAWDRPAVERRTISLIEQECPARWGRYHPVAVDDTKLHRTSERVWGTCTFHESVARSPNRLACVYAQAGAETVRARQLGGDGRYSSRSAMDVSAPFVAALFSPEPAPGRGALSNQDRMGVGTALACVYAQAGRQADAESEGPYFRRFRRGLRDGNGGEALPATPPVDGGSRF